MAALAAGVPNAAMARVKVDPSCGCHNCMVIAATAVGCDLFGCDLFGCDLFGCELAVPDLDLIKQVKQAMTFRKY
jgi:hypothetical protein